MKNLQSGLQSTPETLAREVENYLSDTLRHVDALNAFIAQKPETSGKATIAEVLKENGVYGAAVRKALKVLNDAVAAHAYCAANDVVEVLTKGEIPAYALVECDDGYTLELTTTRPTCTGLEPYTGGDLVARCEALRRCAAYVAMEGMEKRDVVLTGEAGVDKQGKPCMVNAPTKAASKYIPDKASEVTKGFVKRHLAGLIGYLTGTEVVVTSAMLRDFCGFMVTRRGWGVRSMASTKTAGDLVLEYVHMLLNGQGKFRVSVKED